MVVELVIDLGVCGKVVKEARVVGGQGLAAEHRMMADVRSKVYVAGQSRSEADGC